MKSTTLLGIVTLLLLGLPLVSAFDCELVEDSDYCTEILNSNLIETEKDSVLSALLYVTPQFPDHEFIDEYNRDIEVNEPPEDTELHNSNSIRNAWLSFLAVFPSVYENDLLYIPATTKVLSEYNYNVQVPSDYRARRYPQNSGGDCKRRYSLRDNTATLRYYLNNFYRGQGKFTSINIPSDGILKAQLDISTRIRVKHYHWREYRFWGRTYHRCRYDHTSYQRDRLRITEEKEISLYDQHPTAAITYLSQYRDTTKGTYQAENYSFFKLSFEDSELTEQRYFYDLTFEKKPHHIAYLRGSEFSRVTSNNLYLTNNTFYVQNAENCQISAYNHFHEIEGECNPEILEEEVEELGRLEERDLDLSLLLYTLTFLLIIFIFYKIFKSQARKIILPLLLILLLIPFVAAEPEEEECGITNLGSCLAQKAYEYLLVVLNAPLLPMIVAVRELLTAEFSVEIFQPLWSIIRYILSFFYIFFFLYAGFIFLTNNANPIKRAHAKDMLKNTFLMVILINSSYYLYDLVLVLNASLTNAILSQIDPLFFALTVDNIINIGLQFIFSSAYGFTLFFTMLFLVIRYIIVSFGVVLLPLGIFLYFTPPLKSYGKFIINLLGIFIFIAFIDLLIILACSMLIELPLFESMKILVMITCFGMVNYTLWLAIKFAMKRSTSGSLKDDFNQAVKYIAMVV